MPQREPDATRTIAAPQASAASAPPQSAANPRLRAPLILRRKAPLISTAGIAAPGSSATRRCASSRFSSMRPSRFPELASASASTQSSALFPASATSSQASLPLCFRSPAGFAACPTSPLSAWSRTSASASSSDRFRFSAMPLTSHGKPTAATTACSRATSASLAGTRVATGPFFCSCRHSRLGLRHPRVAGSVADRVAAAPIASPKLHR